MKNFALLISDSIGTAVECPSFSISLMKASRQKTDTVDPSQFAPGQRWLSETQAELGLGLIIATDFSTVQVHYPAAQQTITYASRNAPLRRVFFEVGDTIVTVEGAKVVVHEVKTEEKRYIYVGPKGDEIQEAQLADTMSNQRPEQRLLSGSCDDGRLWGLRQSSLRNRSYSRSSDVRGLIGGRVSLIPHQLYIAEEVAKRYAPRVLLADEVGLGKTIEACLILHRLHIAGRANRILILVPDALVNQWFVELYRRFAMSLAIFDEERAVSIEAGAEQSGDEKKEINPFFDDQHVICATSWLSGNPHRAAQAIEGQWDLVIVDEAHHLEWSTASSSPEYDMVSALAQKSPGLLLLTATPEQLGREGHFARLRLLDPNRFSDLDEFIAESEKYHDVSDLADRLGTDTPLKKKDFTMVGKLLGKETEEALQKDDTIEHRLEVQNALVDLHGPGRVLFRNRRIVLDNFPKRKAHLVPLEAEEDKAFEAKMDWLAELLKDLDPAKVLLIVHTKEEVIQIEDALRDRISATGAMFHEDLTLLQRDKNAAWFADDIDGARILICSEIGSEGRNFQFAHHLVMFDLPPDPGLLEQRIGRLDRIGQTEDIHIHVPFVEGTGEEMLALWYHNGLGAFEHTVHGASAVYEEFHDELTALMEADCNTREEALPDLLDRVKETKKRIDIELENGRDRLLELSSFDEERGRKLAREIEDRDEDRRLEFLMIKLCDHFGVTVEDLNERSYLFSPEHLFSAETFPGLPEEGITVTFDREEALTREEMVYLTPDHPMVIGAIDSLLSSDHGNAAFFKLENAGEQLLMIEAVSILECVAPEKYHPERFLSPQPIRALIDQKGRSRSGDFPIDRIRNDGRPGPATFLREKSRALKATIPPLLKIAENACEDAADELRKEAVAKMEEVLGAEIERLEKLKEMGHPVRDTEIELAKNEKAALKDYLIDSRLRIDSVRLILALA
ncbi:MAG: SNF2-related protein [Verrucomicrobiales bacterium]|nr:SNF2-related protein [Verrucomicrobiales bacterium]